MKDELNLIFKMARELQQIKQQDLANYAGIDSSTLSHYEAGKPQIDVRTLLKMAPLLSINPDFITGRHHNPFKSKDLIKILIRGAFLLDRSIFQILIRHNNALEFVSLIPHHNVMARIDRRVMPDVVYAVVVRDDLHNIFIIRNRSNSTVLIKQYEESLEHKLRPLITENNRKHVRFRTVNLRDPRIYDLIRNHWDRIRKEDVLPFFKVDTEKEKKITHGLKYLKRNNYTVDEIESLYEQYKTHLPKSKS
ncbi:MAG: helix-turn-helix domain-containing protein [Dissulfurispiraceae bacterium]